MEATVLSDKKKARRESILRAAEDWVYQHGFYKMSLEGLVGTVRVSKSTIYELFGSKEGLVECIVDRFGARLDQGLEAIMHRPGLSTAEKLTAIGHRQGTAFTGLTSKFMEDLRLHAPRLLDKYEHGREQRYERVYYPLIRQGIAEGLFEEGLDVDFLVQLFMKMSDMLAKTDMLDHLAMSRVACYDAVMRVFLKGTRKAP